MCLTRARSLATFRPLWMRVADSRRPPWHIAEKGSLMNSTRFLGVVGCIVAATVMAGCQHRSGDRGLGTDPSYAQTNPPINGGFPNTAAQTATPGATGGASNQNPYPYSSSTSSTTNWTTPAQTGVSNTPGGSTATPGNSYPNYNTAPLPPSSTGAAPAGSSSSGSLIPANPGSSGASWTPQTSKVGSTPSYNNVPLSQPGQDPH